MRLLARVRDWLRHDDGTCAAKGSLVEPRNMGTELLIAAVIIVVGGAAWCVVKAVEWLLS